MAKKDQTLGTAIDEIISALEGLEPTARGTAVTAACEHLGIPIDKALPFVPGSPPPPPPPPAPAPAINIKTLKEEKQPKGAIEMACVVAYYLQELAPAKEQKDKIAIADIGKHFKQAKFKLPKSIQYTLINAKNAGYFDSLGSGSYKLNAVGYNLVVHILPRKKSES